MPIHIKGSGGESPTMVKCTVGSNSAKNISFTTYNGSMFGAMTPGASFEVAEKHLLYAYVMSTVTNGQFYVTGEAFNVSRDDDAKASAVIIPYEGDFTIEYR